MKLRIKGDSIRLRLSKTEVSQLVENNKVFDSCQFGLNVLKYGIKTADIIEFDAQLDKNEITIFIPQKETHNWDENDKISINKTLENGVSILVEKDFKCLIDRAHEMEDDMYDNPSKKDFS